MKRAFSKSKGIALFILVLMLVQLLPVNAFAAAEDVKLVLEPSKTTAYVGDDIDMAIVVTNTDSLPDIYSGGTEPRGVNGFSTVLEYNNSAFTAYDEASGYTHGAENPLTAAMYGPSYESSAVKVLQIFSTSEKLTNLSDKNGDKKVTLCSLKFKATKAGTYTFRIRPSATQYDTTCFAYLSGGAVSGYDLPSTSIDVTVQSLPVPTVPPGGGGVQTYTISYNGNGATSGTAPTDNNSYSSGASATVLSNSGKLAKKGFAFTGWNTKADGTGTSYAAGSKITMGSSSVILYATWGSSISYNNEDWAGGGQNNYIVAYYPSNERIIPMCYYDDVTSFVVFKAKNPDLAKAKYNFVTFSDISEDFWASEYIWFMSARGIINGMGDGTYQPASEVTRAQFVKILALMVDEIDFASYPNVGFADVKQGQWHEPYINWAASSKIVEGYGNGYFGPDDPITREQMCCMIDRFITYLNYDVQNNSSLAPYTDESSIDEWALKSVKRLQSSGLVNGKPNNLFDPLGKSTRAEAATIVCRLLRAMISSMESNGKVEWKS